MTNEPFGAVIRRHRERQGLTPYALAKAAGLSQSHLARIESGEQGTDPRRGMTLVTAQRLCQALGISLSEFDLSNVPEVERK